MRVTRSPCCAAPVNGITVGELGAAVHGTTREFLERVQRDPAVPEGWHDWAERALGRERLTPADERRRAAP